ncbi:PepSY-associated TM helix domain-containing protein [Catellatospora paridis]|uniref:PepSY-associated TM helix domain-containing protein n=1 Tax=Catellatospora paridis TaxID=1617086 RepID=UPI0012D37854|nr:PepSY-associated TM helix domain-containing protein [Catellatospora paridis]
MTTATRPTAPAAPAEVPAEHAPAEPAARSALYSGFGPLLRRLHFYAGVLVAPFLLVSALTGLLYAFTPQFDQIAYHDQLHVDAVGTSTVALSQQVATAQQTVPGGTLVAVHPAGAPDATTKVDFALPELGENVRSVYIDPYTGHVRGVLATWFGSTPIATWLDKMHANLNLGEAGSIYSELAASWLWVLVLGGVVLWWRHQRGRRTARRLLLADPGASGVRRTRSLHAVTGLWLAVFLLILSATGLTWSTYAGANFDAVRSVLNSDAVPLNTSLDGITASGEGAHHGSGTTGGTVGADLDAIAAAAAKSHLTGPTTITPGEPGQAWTVEQVDNTWPVHKDKIAVHPHTGQIVDFVAWADQPLLSKLTTAGIMVHMGVLFGLPNQIALALIALGLITVIVWGYRMWWRRRPTRDPRRHRLGTPPPRGTWRHVPVPALVITVLVVVAIGWALPLLGLTLLAFIVLDAVAGLVRRRAGRRNGAVPQQVTESS